MCDRILYSKGLIFYHICVKVDEQNLCKQKVSMCYYKKRKITLVQTRLNLAPAINGLFSPSMYLHSSYVRDRRRQENRWGIGERGKYHTCKFMHCGTGSSDMKKKTDYRETLFNLLDMGKKLDKMGNNKRK